MNLNSGFYKIYLDDHDQEKMVLFTPDDICEFLVMLLRFCMTPAMLQRVTDTVLGELEWRTTLVYFADAVVFSGIFRKHFERLMTVCELIVKAENRKV